MPLAASRRRVTIPNKGEVLATLVAPMLPLPVARTSAPRKTRTSKYPKGMDPSKYPPTAAIRMGCAFMLPAPKAESARFSYIAIPGSTTGFDIEKTRGPSSCQILVLAFRRGVFVLPRNFDSAYRLVVVPAPPNCHHRAPE